jgi:hypothetical protein
MDINWKNLMKVLGVIIGVALVWATICYVAHIPDCVGGTLGFFIGMPGGFFAVLKWPPLE